jgi:hypothetical protein
VVAKTLPENLIGKPKSTISEWTLTSGWDENTRKPTTLLSADVKKCNRQTAPRLAFIARIFKKLIWSGLMLLT